MIYAFPKFADKLLMAMFYPITVVKSVAFGNKDFLFFLILKKKGAIR